MQNARAGKRNVFIACRKFNIVLISNKVMDRGRGGGTHAAGVGGMLKFSDL